MEELQDAASTESKLLDSALALFCERGYRGASIREIIERAGVTRPVLYYYFKNKEDLFCRLVESSFADLESDLDQIIHKPGACCLKLKALMGMTFSRAERAPEMVRLLLQALFSSQSDGLRLDTTKLVEGRLERTAEIMQAGLDSGELAGGDAPTLALAFVGVMDMYIMAKVHRPEFVLTQELADYLVDLFMQGAAAGAGRKIQTAFPLLQRGGAYQHTRDMRQSKVAET